MSLCLRRVQQATHWLTFQRLPGLHKRPRLRASGSKDISISGTPAGPHPVAHDLVRAHPRDIVEHEDVVPMFQHRAVPGAENVVQVRLDVRAHARGHQFTGIIATRA
jgi:hypothetical protein